MSASVEVRKIPDKQVVVDHMMQAWGSSHMTVGMQLFDVAEIEAHGLYAPDGRLLAFASWTMRGNAAILCALHALEPGQAYARQLLDALRSVFSSAGARKIRAVTTNDNMPALVFYQKYGFRLSGVFIGGIDAYRPKVPTAHQIGYLGIPIRDTIELELPL